MKLYICEKPSQVGDYCKAIGGSFVRKNGYVESGELKITWCVGHLLTSLEPQEYDPIYEKWSLDTLPILPKEKWALKVSPSKKEQVKVIQSLLKEADEVIIASDPDREGEAIVVSLLEKFNYKGKRTRVWTSSLDKVSLTKAISKQFDASLKFNEYLSASTRMKADWIHGMNLTRGMTVANRGKVEGVLSIGRVQTAVLNLVVKRDLEIDNFKSSDYFNMNATFKMKDGFVKADWVMPKSIMSEDNKCIDRNLIDPFLQKVKGKDAIVSKNEKTRKSEEPPLFFSLNALQIECDSKFGLGISDTLNIAQSLYETHKATTYPRTDCEYLNLEQFNEVNEVINSVKRSDRGNGELIDIIDAADLTRKTKAWNTAKVAGSAHHAIVPTLTPFDISKLNENELKVYDLIRRRYIANFYPNSESDSTKIEITCENEIFRLSGTMPVSSGWKDIVGKRSETKELPFMTEGDILTDTKPKLDVKNTKPPARYTEGALVADMKNPSKYIEDKKLKAILKETDGIGTEATRPTIFKNLFDRKFMKKEKNNIISTDTGKSLIQYAPDKCKSIEMTAFWESQLEKISKGELSPEDFLLEQENVLNEMLDEIKSGKCTFKQAVGSLYTCPSCNSGLKKIKSKKNGKIYWICMAGESCNSIFEDNRGKPLYPKKVEQGDVEHSCEVCESGKLERKANKSDSFFWVCKEQSCKQIYSDVDMIPKIYIKEVVDQGSEKHMCFSCGKSNLERKKGQYGIYWNCSKCRSNFKDENMKPLKPIEKPKGEHKCPNCGTGYLALRKGKKGDFFGCDKFPKCKTIVGEKDGKPLKS